MCRRRVFLAAHRGPGFTLPAFCSPQFPRHLRPFPSETHARFALRSVRPFASAEIFRGRGLPCPASARATTASADSLRRAEARRPFRREAGSPRVRTLALVARPPNLRGEPLASGASRSLARSPQLTPPHIGFLCVGPRLREGASFRRLVASPSLLRRSRIAETCFPFSGQCPCRAHQQ